MIELILKNYLDKTLDIPVLLEHKKSLKDKFLILEKTGGN